MQITKTQIEQVNKQIQALVNAEKFYGKKLEGGAEICDFLPRKILKSFLSPKNDLREAYPLGLMTAPEEKIIRIHSSSGTTGLPVIIPYTAKDVDDWAIMFKRCYETAGITEPGPHPDYARLRTVDGRYQLSKRSRKTGRHGHPYGAGKHGQTTSDDDRYAVHRSLFYLHPMLCFWQRKLKNAAFKTGSI